MMLLTRHLEVHQEAHNISDGVLYAYARKPQRRNTSEFDLSLENEGKQIY